MRITHMSDIHGDFETLDTALAHVVKEGTDVLAITGDLIGPVFDSKIAVNSNGNTEQITYANALEALAQVRPKILQQTQGKISTYHDIAQALTNNSSNAPLELKAFASQYLASEELASKRASEQYSKIGLRLADLPNGIEVVLIPGNWDMKQITENKILRPSYIHKTSKDVKGVRFAGYGSSLGIPYEERPIDLTIPFNSDDYSDFLLGLDSPEQSPEIVLLHSGPRFKTPYGFSGEEYAGNAYLAGAKNPPALMLIGHMHNFGIIREPNSGTVISSSGNVGRFPNHNFGTFSEVVLDDKLYVTSITPKKVDGKDVKVFDKIQVQ